MPSTLKNKNLMVANVLIEYSIYQFSGELKGREWSPPPSPRS